jgi:hypothetical protein
VVGQMHEAVDHGSPGSGVDHALRWLTPAAQLSLTWAEYPRGEVMHGFHDNGISYRALGVLIHVTIMPEIQWAIAS